MWRTQSMNIKKLIEKINKDWPAKIICLCLAIFIYAFHQILTLESKTVTLPLTVNSSGTLMSKNISQSSVKVYFKTDSAHINLISAKDLKAYIDLTPYTENGIYDIPVKLELSEDLKNIDPFEFKIKPESVKLNLEEKVLKYIPVVASTSGEPDYGYYVSNLSVVPSSVKVVGPSSVIEKTKQIYTKKVIIKGAKKTFSVPTKIDNINSLIQVYPEGDGDFRVDVEVSPEMSEKSFSNVTPKILNLSEHFTISSELPKISFILAGPKVSVENFSLKEDSVYIDCKKILTIGEHECYVLVKTLDSLLSVKNLENQTVKITVGEKPKEVLEIENENLTSEENQNPEETEN